MIRLSRFPFGKRVESAHFVQFYEDDAFIVESVSQFIATGLEAGHAGVTIATEAHREGLVDRLTARGVDVAAARKRGQFISLDAAETLSKFMVNDWPNEGRFVDVIGSVIARAGSKCPRVRAFGGMVALLWTEGNQKAALRLEELWSNLANVQFFSLFCAYPMCGFSENDDSAMRGICATHSHVIPTGYKIG